MHRTLDRATLEATVHLLLASFVLIAIGLAGIGGTPLVAGLLFVATVVLFAVRGSIPPLRISRDSVLVQFVPDIWIATALATTTTAVALGVSPAEMQSLGGILGLMSLANYFLRPVYHVGYSLVENARDDSNTEKHYRE